MSAFTDKHEFLLALATVIDAWKKANCTEAIALLDGRVLPVAAQGLTDHWGDLLEGLKQARAVGASALAPDNQHTLDQLISAAARIVQRS